MEAAHKNRWEIFEVVFGVPFLVAIALQMAVPLSLPRGALTSVFILAGAGLIVAGLTFVVLARRELARQGQPTDPGVPTKQLVTTAVFSVSRNPLYLGGACFVGGIALVANLPWALILLLPTLVACQYILIAPEERYLAAKFGEAYGLYTRSVHRWLGRARR